MSSVASFFVSRVDTEVDRRLDAIGSPEALAARGTAAVAQAQVAYELFHERFRPNDGTLAARGARVQRPVVGVDVDEEPGVSRHPVRRRR